MSRVIADLRFEVYLQSYLTYLVKLYLESYRKVYLESLVHPVLESSPLFVVKLLKYQPGLRWGIYADRM